MAPFTRQPHRLAKLVVGSAAAVGVLLATDHVLARLLTRNIRPSFRYAVGTQPGPPDHLFVGFHGLGSGPARYEPILDFLRDRGDVLLVANGADVAATPAATLDMLQRNQLAGRDLCVIGFSMGSQTLVQFLRLYHRATGRPVPRAVVISGMARPSDVIWPRWYLPIVVRLLGGGPLVHLGWKRYWQYKLKQSLGLPTAEERELLAANITASLQVHPRTVLSGARLLTRGVRLRRGEFAGTQVLVIEHLGDHLVRGCFAGWHEAAPHARHATIDTAAHADLAGCAQQYMTIIGQWLDSLPDTNPRRPA